MIPLELLFGALSLLFAVLAARHYIAVGNRVVPAVKAWRRIAMIFFIVSLSLAVWL